MKHRLSLERYLILLAVMLSASIGDTLLSHGMRQMPPITVHHLGLLLVALKNPWVVSGIVLLIGFFASYLTALSWADLSFVIPLTAFSYVVVALLSRFWLHETISIYRWAGIALIVCAVGFVAGGPSRTEHPSDHHELDLMDSGTGR
jgi:drug/metabolite transporter (DMT)-like permease